MEKPSFIQTIESLILPLRLYFDWDVPFMTKLIPTVIFLLYLFIPTDIIIDYIPAFGIVDDAAVLTGCSYLLVKMTPEKVLQKYYPPSTPKKTIEIESPTKKNKK